MDIKRILCCCSILIVFASHAQLNMQAAESFIKRTVASHSNQFIVEALASIKNEDAFEIESKNGKVVLRGNNAGSVASALYFYLTNYCHAQITWNGTNLKLPISLPVLKEKVSKSSSYQYRYYLNYCTFNYTMSWWDWMRWEKEID